MKFGRRVKFIVNNDMLKEYEIAGDVQQLSKLIDIIQDKSNKHCIIDLLSNIQSSMDQEQI